jgi:hypothetical protein
MWVVVFNHKTESPTFVIAMFGVSLWAVVEPPSLARSLLIGFAFVGTSLSSTDFVPRALRQQIVRPLAIKAVPILLLWVLTVWQLLVRMPGGEFRSPPQAASPAPIPGARSD